MTQAVLNIIYKGLAMAMLLPLSLCAFAQEDALDKAIGLETIDGNLNREVLHSTMFGGGTNTVYDSYLSPYKYDNTEIRIQRETMRMTKLWGGRVSNQSFIDANIGYGLDHHNNAPDTYVGGIRYNQAWLYNFRDCNIVNPAERTKRKWNYAAGLQASGFLGGVYMNRSGNNPGQLKLDLMVNATGIVSYAIRFRRHRPILLSYQLTFPLMGVAFSPAYGQSYYEIFELEETDHNAVFANTFNMPSNRHRFMVDIPTKRATFRAGVEGQVNQSRFNKLEYNSTSYCFLLGFTKYFYRR